MIMQLLYRPCMQPRVLDIGPDAAQDVRFRSLSYRWHHHHAALVLALQGQILVLWFIR